MLPAHGGWDKGTSWRHAGGWCSCWCCSPAARAECRWATGSPRALCATSRRWAHSRGRPNGPGGARTRRLPFQAPSRAEARRCLAAGRTSPRVRTSLVDEAAGLTPEVLEAKLLQAELEAPGPRLSGNVARAGEAAPLAGGSAARHVRSSALWGEYVAYCERRLAELQQRTAVKGPLRWEGYERMRGVFARGLAFERLMVALLRADAALPRAQRRWLRTSTSRASRRTWAWRSRTPQALRFADVLVIEERPPAGQPPRVETFSFKSRDLSPAGGRRLDGADDSGRERGPALLRRDAENSAAIPHSSRPRCSAGPPHLRGRHPPAQGSQDLKAAMEKPRERFQGWRCLSNEDR